MNNLEFFLRKIYPSIKEHIESRDITIITGMRRTGKTTIVKQLLAELDTTNKVFLDLEKMSSREMFQDSNYDNVIFNLKQLGLTLDQRMFVGIDEIQTLPNISSVIKYLHDHYDIKFILTGSSSYYLKNLFSESLAGRKKLFELFPLDFGEFLVFKKIPHMQLNSIQQLQKINKVEFHRLKDYYEEYIQFGGFPKVVLAQTTSEKKDILEDIISSYINIDIRNISDFKDVTAIFGLIKMLAARTGSKLDVQKLSKSTGLTRPTVQKYIYLFERTYLISLINVFSRNKDREITKAKKIYFNDNGLVNILADLESGSKFENALFNQLRVFGDIKYFSLKSGKEIDFIVNQKIAFEAKETPIESDKLSLHGLSTKAKITENKIIGKFISPTFEEYIWGGSIL